MAIVIKSPEEIDQMAAAGRVVARCHRVLRTKAQAGVTTAELDTAAERFIRSQGGIPVFKGYRGFPGSICASPNSLVVHGFPGPYQLSPGGPGTGRRCRPVRTRPMWTPPLAVPTYTVC